MKALFRRRKGLLSKDLGWGYAPTSFEGLTIIIAYLLLLVFVIFLLEPWFLDAMQYLYAVVFSFVLILILFCDVTCNEPYIFKRRGKKKK
ncbi:MAG: hypothetical protein ACMXYK_05105 [Candidatus Woesearchaeota archaeon]